MPMQRWWPILDSVPPVQILNSIVIVTADCTTMIVNKPHFVYWEFWTNCVRLFYLVQLKLTHEHVNNVRVWVIVGGTLSLAHCDWKLSLRPQNWKNKGITTIHNASAGHRFVGQSLFQTNVKSISGDSCHVSLIIFLGPFYYIWVNYWGGESSSALLSSLARQIWHVISKSKPRGWRNGQSPSQKPSCQKILSAFLTAAPLAGTCELSMTSLRPCINSMGRRDAFSVWQNFRRAGQQCVKWNNQTWRNVW